MEYTEPPGTMTSEELEKARADEAARRHERNEQPENRSQRPISRISGPEETKTGNNNKE